MKSNQTSSKTIVIACVILLVAALAAFPYPTDLEKLIFLEYQYRMEIVHGEHPEFSMALWMLADAYMKEQTSRMDISHHYWDWDKKLDIVRLYSSGFGEQFLLDLRVAENLMLLGWRETDPIALLDEWADSLQHFRSVYHPENKYAAVRVIYHRGSTFQIFYAAR